MEKLRRLFSLRLWLFIATFFSTNFAGVTLAKQFNANTPGGLFSGLPYAFSIMLFLGLHEAGHYLAARWWGLEKVTPPMFIPMPFTPLGTMGAVINIKEPLPNRKALFDLGVAGPWAGLLAVVGLWQLTGLFSYSSALFQVDFAVTVGTIVTFINLFPFGCLDGGHIFYAVVGKKHRWLKYLVLVPVWYYAVAIQKIFAPGILIIFIIFFGLGHVPTKDNDIPLGRPRQIAAWITLLIFLGLDSIGRQLSLMF